MFNKEVTPNIYDFSKKALVFEKHFSGGNASRFGVFSIFYSMYGYYWHPFLSERKGPVFIDELMKLNYDFYISASTRLTYPEFRKTAFIKIPNYIYDELEGEDARVKDVNLMKGFINFLEKRDKTKPFFSFLFFDAPHGTSYPKKYEKFTPSTKSINYLTLDNDEEKNIMARNTYKNCIYFNDDLIGLTLKKIKELNFLDDTIILISADHGQEFYEQGFFGHCSAFTKYQIQVPLILYIPNEKPRQINYKTSHFDVVPTMFDILGYDENYKDYSMGFSLLQNKAHKYIVSSGWDDSAIYDGQNTIIFSTETYNMNFFEIRDENYKLVKDYKEKTAEKKDIILEVLKDFSWFKK